MQGTRDLQLRKEAGSHWGAWCRCGCRGGEPRPAQGLAAPDRLRPTSRKPSIPGAVQVPTGRTGRERQHQRFPTLAPPPPKRLAHTQRADSPRLVRRARSTAATIIHTRVMPRSVLAQLRAPPTPNQGRRASPASWPVDPLQRGSSGGTPCPGVRRPREKQGSETGGEQSAMFELTDTPSKTGTRGTTGARADCHCTSHCESDGFRLATKGHITHTHTRERPRSGWRRPTRHTHANTHTHTHAGPSRAAQQRREQQRGCLQTQK